MTKAHPLPAGFPARCGLRPRWPGPGRAPPGSASPGMAGRGARLAGKRFLGIEFDQEEHARALRQALGNLKGPLMKVAQFLSTVPEAIPDEYVAELSQLQSNARSEEE